MSNEKELRRRIRENVVAAARIDWRDLSAERALTDSKWFAYRFMSAYEATHLFAKTYQDIYRAMYRRDRDRARSDKLRPVNWRALMSEKPNREFTQLWMARQFADSLGMPYPIYLHACFDFHSRRTRDWQPRPNQLLGSSEAKELLLHRLSEVWSDCVWTELQKLRLPQYQIINFRGIKSQLDYRQFVLRTAREALVGWKNVVRTFSIERREVPGAAFKSVLTDPDQRRDVVLSMRAEYRGGVSGVFLAH